MKKALLVIGLFIHLEVLGQKARFFSGISFDSSYTVVGLAQGYGRTVDSMERFWFILEDPEDMKQIQRDWIFKKQGDLPGLQFVSLDVYVIQGKRLAAKTGVIIPRWGIVTNGSGGWYRFDTAKLVALHARHPLRYHREDKRFQTYLEYAAYGNSELNDPKLLFFTEPNTRYQGKFEVTSGLDRDPASLYFVLRDVDREMELLAPKGSWESGLVLNDSFNIHHPDSVKTVVHCSKALYDKYEARGRQKGPWQPEPIEITLYWRDDQ